MFEQMPETPNTLLRATQIVDALFGSNNPTESKLWEDLVNASRLAQTLKLNQAKNIYDSIVRSDTLEKIFALRKWPVESAPTEPSLSWACIYLREYAILNLETQRLWLRLAKSILNDSACSSISDRVKSNLVSTRGFLALDVSDESLKAIISEQLKAIESYHIDGLELAHHHLVIGDKYRLLREPKLTFHHIQQALTLYTQQGIPYYIYQANQSLADAYFHLNDFDRNYYFLSLESYQKAFDTLPEKDPVSQCQYHYNVGWVYSESGWIFSKPELYDSALYNFYEGYNIAYQNALEIELAKHEWGLGRTYYLLQDYQESLKLLQSASLRFEAYQMKLLTAMCLQVEAACLQKIGRIDEALELVMKRGLPLQRQVDDPVQLYHMLRRAVSLCRNKKNYLNYKPIITEYIQLKSRIRK